MPETALKVYQKGVNVYSTNIVRKMRNVELAGGIRTRRVHLRLVDAKYQVALCGHMMVEERIMVDPFRPMVNQVTCANCLRAIKRDRKYSLLKGA